MTDPQHGALVSARITCTSPKIATVFAKTHRFDVGEGLSFDEKDGRISAVEYLIGALAADLIGGFKRLAAKRRLEVDEVEALAEGVIANPLVHLGVVGEEGEPHLTGITLKVFASTFADHELIEAVWQEAQRRSPLANTLKRALQLELRIEVTH